MALHDFTMQRWWMESLTAKIIVVVLELPEFCFFSFFFKRLSTERCRLHHHADGPSLRVAVGFLPGSSASKGYDGTRDKRGRT